MGRDALAGQKLPRLHGRASAAPPTHHEPRGQPMQVTLPVWLAGAYVPSLQLLGMGATLPSAQV